MKNESHSTDDIKRVDTPLYSSSHKAAKSYLKGGVNHTHRVPNKPLRLHSCYQREVFANHLLVHVMLA